MTHNDIYIKFMIEYDKANVTSSYPSLTEYEVATILNKAYLALIAQKFTGNNLRRSAFESDKKSVADLQPLVTTKTLQYYDPRPYKDGMDVADNPVSNVFSCDLPGDMLYYVSSVVKLTTDALQKKRVLNTKLVDHETAKKFFTTATNIPWVKTPVVYLEDDKMFVVYDEYLYYGLNERGLTVDVSNAKYSTAVTLTYIKQPKQFTAGSLKGKDKTQYQTFELSNSMAEELISLAVTMSAEIVESNRLGTKLNTRQLES